MSCSFHVPPTGGAALQRLVITCLSDQINAHDLSLRPSFPLVVPSIPVVKRKAMGSFFAGWGVFLSNSNTLFALQVEFSNLMMIPQYEGKAYHWYHLESLTYSDIFIQLTHARASSNRECGINHPCRQGNTCCYIQHRLR